ncbi:MAG: RsmE family RNA methyltransferase [Bacteroidetes bacterium]|nr:RsmE family RNA methyltransferase [Bacteroidota bacterium]
MNVFFHPASKDSINYLSPEESHHCVKVLRLTQGQEIHIVDGAGTLYLAQINHAHPRNCEFLTKKIIKKETRSFYIHIAISPTKNFNRIEWFVEKAVELGVDEISFIQCERSERKILKTERLHKKAVSSLKQSGNLILPKINNLRVFEDFVAGQNINSYSYICHQSEDNPSLIDQLKRNQTYLVLIGPEGDFSPNELELARAKGCTGVNLGRHTLRTETAGIAACHIFNLANQ